MTNMSCAENASGTKLKSQQLDQLSLEEAKRQAAGMSGVRRAFYYVDYEKDMDAEGRHTSKKGGERIMAAIVEDGVTLPDKDKSADQLNRPLNNYMEAFMSVAYLFRTCTFRIVLLCMSAKFYHV